MNVSVKVLPLGDLCHVVGGGTPPKDRPEYYNGDIPWATVRDMRSEVIEDTEFKITRAAVAASATNVIPAGNVVIATRVGLGKVCLIEQPTAINQDLRGVMPRDPKQLEVKYLFWWLKSVAHLIEKEGTGATVQGVKLPFVKSLRLPLRSISEQRRIVAILDQAFDGIATAKANAEKNLQNAREVFESYAKGVFAQGAESWPTRTIDQIATNLDSKRVPITKSDRKAGEFPYYGASGIVDYVADYIFEGDTLLVSEDGANLLARSTPIAFSVSGRYWVNNHAHILKFNHMATQRFVEFYLESIPLDEYITGAAQPKLNQKAMNSIPISIPSSVDEQAQVVDRLDGLAEQSELLQGMHERKLAALHELKKSLLHQAFSGTL